MIKVGKIVGVFGIHGEMKFQHYCNDFSSFFNIKKLYDESDNEYSLTYLKPHKNIGILKLEGIDRIEEAEALLNKELFANKEDFDLDEDEFFLDDIIGFEGYSIEGKFIGKLEYIQEVGAKQIYVFNGDKMVPKELVKDIDFTEKKIIVGLIEGLLEINEN